MKSQVVRFLEKQELLRCALRLKKKIPSHKNKMRFLAPLRPLGLEPVHTLETGL